MFHRHFVLTTEEPDEGYWATLTDYRPDDPRRSWIFGEPFEAAPPLPLRARVRGLDDEDTAIPDLWRSPLPVMSQRLLTALLDAGVDSLQTFDLELTDAASGAILRDHVAFNVVRQVAPSELAPGQRAASALPAMFRLSGALATLVVDRSVREHIERAGIRTVAFHPLPAAHSGQART